MDLGLISVRYARALLKASEEAGVSDKVYADMQVLSDSYIKVPDLRFTIDNPMLPKKNKEQLAITASGGSPTGLTRSFLKLILKEDRENVIQFMANSFIGLYRKKNNLTQAKLVTASELSPATERKLQQLVEGMTSGRVEFESEVNPEIIGGFILEYDTYRMDQSVRTQLGSILSKLK